MKAIFVSTQFSALFVQASLNIVSSIVGMPFVQHVFKCALISLGNVCCCVCVLFVKDVVLLSQIFTDSATVAVLL